MKFQKLTIHNIASIEDAEIDFDSAPLADSEVFLITGKTGAGKSTILDAICLALYADTPRLDATKMQGVTMDAKKEVKIDDPRQLMRRNTTEAFAKLSFLGSNGVSYEATWSVARAYKKINGSIKSKVWELKNLDSGSILTKDAEIRNEIKMAVGLDFSQFCRTTMLAQGEFTRFLNSKDDEKAEILEKITGVDIYSKIGAKIFEITGQKKQLWDDAKRIVESMRTLTDEEIEDRNKQLAELDSQQKELRVLSEKDIAKRDWINTNACLTQDVANATEELRKATDVVEGEEFKEKESIVREWNATIDARLWMSECTKSNLSIKELKNDLEALADDYDEIISGQKYAEQETTKLAEEIETVDRLIDKEKHKAHVYDNAQTIAGLISTISEGRKAIAKGGEEIAKEKKSLTEILMPAWDDAKQEAKATKQSFEISETEVIKQEENLAMVNLANLRLQRDSAKELIGHINTAKERIETLLTARLQRERNRKTIAERLSTLNDKKKQSADMDTPIHDAELTLNIRKEDLDKQKDTIDKFASSLRLKLNIGDTCPVCRQTIVAELPHEEELYALVSGLQQAYDKAAEEHKKLIEAKNKIEAEIKAESTAYDKDIKALNEDTTVEMAEAKAVAACKACGIDVLDETATSTLKTLNETTTIRMNELDAKIKDGEAMESGIKKLRKEVETRRKEMETVAEKVAKAEKAASDSKGRIHTAETLINSKRMDVELAEQRVGEFVVIADDSWEIAWKEMPNEFANALKAAANTYNTNCQIKQSLKAKLDNTKSYNQNVDSVINSIAGLMPEWKESMENGSKTGEVKALKIDNILDKANAIENKVTIALTKLKSAEENYSTNKQKLDTFIADNEQLTVERLTALSLYSAYDIAQEGERLKQQSNLVVAKKTLLDNATKQYAEHQLKKPELKEEEDGIENIIERIAEYQKCIEEIGEIRGSINQELRTDAENKQKLGTLIKEAEEKKAVYQKWSRLNQLIGNATGSAFRKIAQSYVLSSLIHSANSYMKTLTDRYTLKVVPGTFVISLEDAYQGFVSRAASTISGGESFLVSLSLALALSDIGQQWQVDTLFIDEGFGTLSGEPLQKAIETLRSLHSKSGRHVGIISHVEELQERIAVQIQVNQEGNNSSSKIKIIQ